MPTVKIPECNPEQIGKNILDLITRMQKMQNAGYKNKPINTNQNRKTNAKRLAYYRTHGLKTCPDYPGGDEAFRHDVLSGKQHDTEAVNTPMKREDAYIYKAISTGRLKYDTGLSDFIAHPMLKLAYYKNAQKNGLQIEHLYPGGPEKYEMDIMLNLYAEKQV